MKILVINGPNLNMLGIREPDHYGKETYKELCEKIEKYCKEKSISVEIYQSNHEGDLVDRIQKAYSVLGEAKDVAKSYENDIVIGSDTIVIVDNEVLNKPKDKEDAKHDIWRTCTLHRSVENQKQRRHQDDINEVDKCKRYKTHVWLFSI